MKIPPNTWIDTFGHRLGQEFETVGSGKAVATLEIRQEHCNPNHVAHGGAVFTLADDVMGAAAHSICADGLVPTATQVNIHLVRSARPGDWLRAEAEVTSSGKNTALLEARVTNDKGRLVARTTATFLLIQARYT